MTTPFDTANDSVQDLAILKELSLQDIEEDFPLDEDDVDFMDDDTFDNDFEGDFIEDEEEDDYEDEIIASMFPNDEDREDW